MHQPTDTRKTDEETYASALKRAEKIAVLLDSKFKVPGTSIGFGLDALVGLIPGIGDTLMLAPQLYLVFEARRLHLGWAVIFKMLLNLGFDWLIGLIPVIGDVFDIVFRSNTRNAKLIRAALEKRILNDT